MYQNNYVNPYVLQAQQRLNQYEQQYPQYAQYNQVPQPQYQNVQQTQNSLTLLKGKAVTSIDEAKASSVDFDGSISVFTDFANGKIYTKQIDLNGCAILKTYILNNENENESSQAINNTANYNELKNSLQVINKNVEELKNILFQKEENKDVKHSATVSNGKSK